MLKQRGLVPAYSYEIIETKTEKSFYDMFIGEYKITTFTNKIKFFLIITIGIVFCIEFCVWLRFWRFT